MAASVKSELHHELELLADLGAAHRLLDPLVHQQRTRSLDIFRQQVVLADRRGGFGDRPDEDAQLANGRVRGIVEIVSVTIRAIYVVTISFRYVVTP